MKTPFLLFVMFILSCTNDPVKASRINVELETEFNLEVNEEGVLVQNETEDLLVKLNKLKLVGCEHCTTYYAIIDLSLTVGASKESFEMQKGASCLRLPNPMKVDTLGYKIQFLSFTSGKANLKIGH